MQVPSLPETANQSGAVLGDKPQAGQNYSQTQAAFGRVTIYFFFKFKKKYLKIFILL